MTDGFRPCLNAPLVFVSNALDPPDDEGTRRLARMMAMYASSDGIPVIAVSDHDPFLLRKFFLSRRLMGDIRRSGAKTVVYLPAGAASVGGLLRAGLLRNWARVPVVMIATGSSLRGFLKETMARTVGPDLILTPSTNMLQDLRRLGLRAAFIPMGVDPDRFLPVAHDAKRGLRRKYGLPEDGPVVLHVGHLRVLRNLTWLVRVHELLGATTAVVGGTALGADARVSAQLTNAGVHVINRYLPHVEEIYQLADAYVFPVMDKIAAIGVPLSVLEAMACNLPIVTTRFDGLPEMFSEGDGFFYADNLESFVTTVRKALNLSPNVVRTRERVLPYSWINVIRVILQRAQACLSKPRGGLLNKDPNPHS